MKFMHYRTRSLAQSMVLWMLLVAVVPLLVMVVQGLHCATQAIVDLESRHLNSVLYASKARIEDWLAERTGDILALAEQPRAWRECADSLDDITGDQKASCDNLINYVQTKNRSYESIAVFDSEWNEVTSSSGPVHIESGDLLPADLKHSLQAAEGVVVMPPHFHEGGEIGIHIGVPVLSSNGVRIGYVVGAMNLSGTVHPILSNAVGMQPESKVYLLTKEGRYVSTPKREIVLLTEARGLPTEIVSGNGGKVSRYRDCCGNRVLGTSVAMPTLGWVLVAESDEARAFAWLRTLRLRAIWTGIFTLCVVSVLAFRSSRRLLMPMRHLSRTARRIADGHWQERVGPLKGAEPAEVGQAFNDMLDELAVVQKRLVQSASLSAIGELTASVVHEMRNPLSSVKMNLKALREHVKDDPNYSELAEIASGQAQRLERMLNDLLRYGKPVELRKEPLRLRDLAGEVRQALAHQADAGRVKLEIHDNTNGLTFAADREQIVRAVTNLVDNAVSVSPRGTTVRINGDIVGDAPNSAVTIAVTDAGPGISEASWGKLFKPFFTTRSEGTGLGLANVRKIVDLHGGTVDAENLPGGSARFTLTLPLGGTL